LVLVLAQDSVLKHRLQREDSRNMRTKMAIGGVIAGALCVAALAAAPAIGAAADRILTKPAVVSMRGGIGTFTPAAGDPRLAAALARSGITGSGFRFTPAASADGRARAVTVAVRAHGAAREVAADRLAPSLTNAVGIAPVAYSLGAGVGWKRFALTGDVQKIDTGIVPGGREGVDVGVSYNASKWSTRVQVAADRPVGTLPRSINGNPSVSLDVGGSFRLTRNFDVTAGVRYKSERDRLQNVTADTRRDSQAVYVGTAFRF
jgi:hypothetical protein